MSDPGKAVFLSYASQDTAAAKRIADALRTAGVEVWFDQSELRGGDAWDAQIRRQIKECALFVPIISAATQARGEGYFRLEWKLAVDRSHLMAEDTAFLFPVVIDDVPNAVARVPDKFREVQWTRLRLDETPTELATRVARLLRQEQGAGSRERGTEENELPAKRERKKRQPGWMRTAWGLIGLAFAVLYLLRPMWHTARPRNAPPPIEATAASPAFSEAQKLERQARALIDDDPLVVRENFKTAVELCERAVALAPDFGDGWATLARANFELYWNYNERSDRALAALRTQVERAVRLAPQSIEAQLAQANFELMNERTPAQAGVAGYRKTLLKLHDQAPGDRRILGALITNQEDKMGSAPTEAVHWAELANALPGGDANALVRLAWVYWSLNQFRELSDVLERSLALQPTSSGYHLKLMLLYACGDLAGAQAWLQQIPPSILQEDRVAAIACQVYFASHQPEKVLEVLSRNPRDFLEEGRYFTARGSLAGEALLMTGKPRAAEVEFRGALRAVEERIALNPRDSRLLYWKALLLARLGNREESLRQLETARELGRFTMLDIEVAALLGRNDEVIAAVDKIIDWSHSRWPSALGNFKYNQVFESLRGDPRAQAIITRGDRWLAELLASPAGGGVIPAPSSLLLATPKPGEGEIAPAPPPLADAKSVAVLPFENRSANKDDAFFTDGIHEDILTNLAHVHELRVVSRTSVMEYRGTTKKIPVIARELGVAYVLEGSVQRAGNKVRVTGQLIRAASDEHVWAQSYDRDLSDVFAIQSELAQAIAGELDAALSPREQKLLAQRPTENTAAYDLYLKARQVADGAAQTRTDLMKVENLLTSAVELDPDFGLAWCALAEIHAGLMAASVDTTAARLAKASAAVERARALIPESPAVARAQGAYFLFAVRDPARAREQFERLVELQPNDSEARRWLGTALLLQGRWREAMETQRLTTLLDPRNFGYADGLIRSLWNARRYDEALAEVRRLMALQPGRLRFEALEIFIQADATGEQEEMNRALERLIARHPDAPEANEFRKVVAANRGDVTEFARLDDAKAAFQTYSSWDADTWGALNAAAFYFNHGESDRARRRLGDLPDKLRAQLELEPNNTQVLRSLAWAESILGHHQDALKWIERAAEIMPESKDAGIASAIRSIRARVLIRAGDLDRALPEVEWLLQHPNLFKVHMLKGEGLFASVRSDPRFEALLNDPKNNAPLF